ncbi:hypothetical protein ACFX13_000209 [Malus domestica]
MEEEQMAQLRKIFRSFDGNKDGSLTEPELGSLLRSLGLKPSHEQLQALIRKSDTNHNGLVGFSEFVALMRPDLNGLLQDDARCPCSYSEDQLREMFSMFDRDANGYISPAELAHSMAKLGHPLTVQELFGMMNEADTDRDGRIDFHEFSRAITSAAFLNINA